MRLLLEGRRRGAATLNIAWRERFKVVLAATALALGAGAVVGGVPALAGASLGLTVMLGVSNLAVYRWFAREAGELFALAVLPLQLWYYFSNAVAAGVAVLAHLGRLAQRKLAGGRASRPDGMLRPKAGSGGRTP
jgi:hypothetical protein